MPSRSHKPTRTCLGCLRRDARSAMLRIGLRGPEIIVDVRGVNPGRGGYLHPDRKCLEKFAGSKIKEFRALKTSIDRRERLRISEEISRVAGLQAPA